MGQAGESAGEVQVRFSPTASELYFQPGQEYK